MSSLRARRIARNHRRNRPARLNLVALMDIFTILVLFLMVNNGDVEVLQADSNITLPESISEQRPERNVTIKVTREHLLVQGVAVSTLNDALGGEEPLIAALQAELRHQAELAGPLDEEAEKTGRPVIIMGDETTPYSLLQRIMSTCAAEDFRDISLAVNSVPAPALAPAAAPRLDPLASGQEG
ncbi:ExbD/TolR family protein [Mangrovimicrobium sediminis]|uniref:ExbD/TolR family protein n=1 Tax=Mangrovimicrobium sediminis TaxID=2562682 RepID=UPI00197F560B|nr:biopolymer transporter ExbD [Haliea sp. SAOS-164]